MKRTKLSTKRRTMCQSNVVMGGRRGNGKR
jgi:hypothetical protein